MAFNLNIEIFGEKQVVRKLADYRESADTLLKRPDVVADLRNAFFAAEREQFGTEGAHGSGGWAPLAASTIRRKAKQGLDPRILHATNRLLRSLLAPGPDSAVDVDDDSVFFGTKVEYAIYHQKGGSLVGKDIEFFEQRSVIRNRRAVGFTSDAEHRSANATLHGKRLPQRKPVELSESDRRRLVRVIQTHLVPGRQRKNMFNPS